MKSETSNRYARRSQTTAMPKNRSLHYHVGESMFLTHQDAAEYARSIASEIRGSTEPGTFLAYVVDVADAVEEMLKIESCNMGC